MNTTMDSLVIDIQSTSTDASSGIDNLIERLTNLKNILQDVAKTSSGLSNLKNIGSNVKTSRTSNKQEKIEQPEIIEFERLKNMQKESITLNKDISNLRVGLNQMGLSLSNFELDDVFKSATTETRKYKDELNTVLTISKKLKDGVPLYKISTKISNLSKKDSVDAIEQPQLLAKNIQTTPLFDEMKSQVMKVDTATSMLQSKLNALNVDLGGAKIISTFSDLNTTITKYRTTAGSVVTITDKIKNGFKKVNVSVKSVSPSIETFSNKLDKVSKTMEMMQLKIMAIVASITKLIRKIGSLVTMASNENEALNLFMVTMGKYAEDGIKWIENFSNALYLDPVQVMQYMGSFNSLIKGLGVGADNAYLMSQNLTQLVYDLSSFKNISIESAYEKLMSGISGELEPLRNNVGVAMSEATLQTLAYELGIEKLVREMTEAEKAQLRYIQIMRSSKEWQTDMGRTLVQPANALRVMRQQFTLLGRAIGKIFIPLLMEAMPYVIAFTQLMTALAERIAKLFGYEIGDIFDYSELGDISASIDGIGNSAEDATKKLNTMLAPFDELNVVQNKSKKAGSGLSGFGGDLGVDLPTYDALARLNTKFAEGAEKAKQNLEKLLPIAESIAVALVAFKLTKFITDISKSISKMGELEKLILGMGLITVGIQVVWRGAEGASHGTLKDYLLGETASLGGVLGGALGGAMIGGGPGAILGGFVVTIAGVSSAIKELVELKPSWDEFWYGVGHAYDDIPILGDWVDWLSEKWSDDFDEMGDTSTLFKAVVSGDFDTIKDYILNSEEKSLPVVLQKTIDFTNDMGVKFTDLKDNISKTWDETWVSIGNTIETKWTSAKTWFSNNFGTKEDWKKTFNSILEGAKDILNDLKSRFENWSAKIKTPHFEWDSKNGFKASGVIKKALEALNLPTTIPKLKVNWYQDGGYPTSGDLFFANENGIPEMIGRIGNKTAVANNDQITTSLINALLSALNQYDFGGGKSPTTIYIGNRKVYEGYGDYVADENDRYGTNMIKI